jgi:hypothetical protein
MKGGAPAKPSPLGREPPAKAGGRLEALRGSFGKLRTSHDRPFVPSGQAGATQKPQTHSQECFRRTTRPKYIGRDPPRINPNQAYIYFTARVKEISETREIPRSVANFCGAYAPGALDYEAGPTLKNEGWGTRKTFPLRREPAAQGHRAGTKVLAEAISG